MGIFAVDYGLDPAEKTVLESEMKVKLGWGSKFYNLIGKNFMHAMGRGKEVLAMGPGQQTAGFIGAPVEDLKGLRSEGGLEILIPELDPLVGLPTALGDGDSRGNEKTAEYAFRRVPVNSFEYTIKPPLGMQKQAVRKAWRKWLVGDLQPQLMAHLNKVMASNFLSAMMYGKSRELIAPTLNRGMGETIVSHPNIIAAGIGEVSYSGGRPGTSGYEAAVEAVINTMLSAQAKYRMSMGFLRDFIQQLPEYKIEGLSNEEGVELTPVFMDSYLFADLQADPEYQDLVKSLTVSSMGKHPLANIGLANIVAGALIITDLKMWCAYTDAMGIDSGITAGTVEYGPRPTAAERARGFYTGDTINQLDKGLVSCIIALGKSALTMATAGDQDIEMIQNVEGYKGVIGIGYKIYRSVVRTESYNKLGLITGLSKDDFYQNNGSAIGLCYHPHTRSYGA